MPWKNLVKIILPALLLSAGCADTHRRPLNINQDRASTQDIQPRRNKIERPQLLKRALRGCDWLADISQIKDKTDRYYGAMKGEYDTKSRRWGMYGPFWHTAQAVRTLILAYKISGDEGGTWYSYGRIEGKGM